MANRYLSEVENAKYYESYTQYTDIQQKIEVYFEYDADTFQGNK